MSSYRVGPVGITIRGPIKYTEVVHAELSHCESDSVRNPDLTISFVDEIDNFIDSHYTVGEKFEFNESMLFVRDRLIDFAVVDLFDGNITKLYISVNECSYKKNILKRVNNFVFCDYKTRSDRIRRTIMNYGLFWWVLYVELLNKGGTFVHGSIVNMDGGATAIIGTGGAGKTSTGLQLISENSNQYLSDDFGVIDSGSVCHLSPRLLTVYMRDLNHKAISNQFTMKNMSMFNKTNWEIQKFRGRNPKRRISPQKLFSTDDIGDQAPLQKVIYLYRTKDSGINIAKQPSEYLANRANAAGLREIRDFLEHLYKIESVADNKTDFPSVYELSKRTQQNLESHFKDVDCWAVRANTNAKPVEIAEKIKSFEISE